MAANHPVVLPACRPSDMISYALQNPSTATILICSTRSAFLSSFISSVEETSENNLLHATLQQIASSRSIALAFLPTISHLRAYLAVFHPKSADGQALVRSDTGPPLLLVYGLVNLHRDTSEWSAQGLGITMASLVESGSRHGFRIVLCEEEKAVEDMDIDAVGAVTTGDEEMGDLQVEEGDDETRKSNCWKEEMPILNGSTRRSIAGADETAGWAGRTVEVGRVLQRWCLFEKG